MSDFIEVIEKYISQVDDAKYHRYTSWENCYEAFGGEKEVDLALHLGFYLASWGMYRGSGGLLQKSHKIHDRAVELIIRVMPDLRSSQDNEVDKSAIGEIIQLKESLQNHYKGFKFVRYSKKGVKSLPGINPTETLMSKILLGTLGCVPAYDRYFMDGVYEETKQKWKFSKEGLQRLFEYRDHKNLEIIEVRKNFLDARNVYYSDMKILDMYFWQKGFEAELKQKRSRAGLS